MLALHWSSVQNIPNKVTGKYNESRFHRIVESNLAQVTIQGTIPVMQVMKAITVTLSMKADDNKNCGFSQKWIIHWQILSLKKGNIAQFQIIPETGKGNLANTLLLKSSRFEKQLDTEPSCVLGNEHEVLMPLKDKH